LRVCSRYS